MSQRNPRAFRRVTPPSVLVSMLREFRHRCKVEPAAVDVQVQLGPEAEEHFRIAMSHLEVAEQHLRLAHYAHGRNGDRKEMETIEAVSPGRDARGR